MRRFILILIAALASVFIASAQPKALGLRAGMDCQLSYEHAVSLEDFVEADLGVEFIYGYAVGVNAAAAYNFMIAQPQWTDRGEWGFYAGPGASVGLGLGEANYLTLGAAGMVGLEYTFWFPLQLSVDFRQHIGFSRGENPLWTPSSIALSVRYRF